MPTFYATFGQAHTDNGVQMKDYYVRIVAADMNIASKAMMERFGDKWANIYGEEAFNPQWFHNGLYCTLLSQTKLDLPEQDSL
jgi:hypothetical protein